MAAHITAVIIVKLEVKPCFTTHRLLLLSGLMTLGQLLQTFAALFMFVFTISYNLSAIIFSEEKIMRDILYM